MYVNPVISTISVSQNGEEKQNKETAMSQTILKDFSDILTLKKPSCVLADSYDNNYPPK